MSADEKFMSLSKFKDAVFEDEHTITYVLSSLSFRDAFKLLQTRSQLLRNPLDVNGQLTLFWDIFLTRFWDEFIHNNLLARFKHANTWNNQIVQVIVAKLREKANEETKTNKLPIFYIPDPFFFGDEELLFVYHMLAVYRYFYGVSTLDLYGQGLPPGVYYLQIQLQDISYMIRGPESEETFETQQDLAPKLFEFMQAGVFTIHSNLPFDESPRELETAMQIDNQLTSSKFAFRYMKNPHGLAIIRKK